MAANGVEAAFSVLVVGEQRVNVRFGMDFGMIGQCAKAFRARVIVLMDLVALQNARAARVLGNLDLKHFFVLVLIEREENVILRGCAPCLARARKLHHLAITRRVGQGHHRSIGHGCCVDEVARFGH